jgi:hypothetical protein
MRIGPNPTLLRIVMAFGVLFTASCTDSAEQVPLNYGSVQMAERGNHHAITDRATQIWMRVARQAMENGHPGIAIRFAKRAVLASPESDEPLRILALVYRQQSDDDKAVIVARDTPKREAAARTSKAYSISPGRKSPVVVDSANREKKANVAPVSFRKRMLSAQPVSPENGKHPMYSIQLAAYVNLHDAVRGKNILTRRCRIISRGSGYL